MSQNENGQSETGQPYYLDQPAADKRVPMILSIPHSGTGFPPDLVENFDEELLSELDDTDWDIDQLYDFASELGVTVIHAKYSRWVIDLNREPNSKPLYDDGRLITALCPTTNFLGADLYKDKDNEPTDDEIQRRLETYFLPYHKKIDSLIEDFKGKFDRVIFWDAHSIRRTVSTINPSPFPDLILGDNDRRSASDSIVNCALQSLKSEKWRVAHNDPFKGGFLTRSKGNPLGGVHALQLEMSKDLYMDADETIYDNYKANRVKKLLKTTFEKLISLL